jgi:alpha-galactosidase
VIAIDQDSLGVQGFKYALRDSVEIWLKPLQNEEWAVAFLNRSVSPKNIAFSWQAEVVNDTVSNRAFNAKAVTYKLRDLYLKKDIGNTKKPLKKTVPGHDVLLLRLRK